MIYGNTGRSKRATRGEDGWRRRGEKALHRIDVRASGTQQKKTFHMLAQFTHVPRRGTEGRRDLRNSGCIAEKEVGALERPACKLMSLNARHSSHGHGVDYVLGHTLVFINGL